MFTQCEYFIWFEEYVILLYHDIVHSLRLHNCRRNLQVECVILSLLIANVLDEVEGIGASMINKQHPLGYCTEKRNIKERRETLEETQENVSRRMRK